MFKRYEWQDTITESGLDRMARHFSTGDLRAQVTYLMSRYVRNTEMLRVSTAWMAVRGERILSEDADLCGRAMHVAREIRWGLDFSDLMRTQCLLMYREQCRRLDEIKATIEDFRQVYSEEAQQAIKVPATGEDIIKYEEDIAAVMAEV